MICTACSSPDWQALFLRLLPAIRRHARIAFRHLDPEGREECVQATICNACCAVARLAELNKLDLAYASVLARHGVAQVRDGRMTGGSLNCNDISSRYCQRAKNITVVRLDHFDEEENCWEEILISDNTCTPAELAASRIDFPAWLDTLSRRDRKVARFLSLGNRTHDAARKFKVSEGRVSQLRREMAESWREFTGEAEDGRPAAA
ncbi:MAG: hypothetical protein ABSF26_21130 [Thermoguttaceae bacterium]|jgi:hypothetical protein